MHLLTVVCGAAHTAGAPAGEPEHTRQVLGKGEAAVVDLQPSWPVLVAPRDDCPVLGSFVMRERNYIVGDALICGAQAQLPGW